MKKLLFCTQKVNREQVKRENRDGIEHIILTSYTLPPNIVMNGGLYPSEEIDKSFESLNRTPATIEHPQINGVYVSANDPEVDFDYRIGAFNDNARKIDDGRIAVDKVINVQKAMMTDKGKRLIDRINELETSSSPRPIHTSVGVFLESEELQEPATNAAGQDYTWVAKNMFFDHDAILLDSVGAATPDQGTGIGINNENVKVEHFNNESEQELKCSDMRTNKEVSFSEISRVLQRQLNQGLQEWENWLVEVYDDTFIFETKDGEMFRSNYLVDDLGNISIQDTRLPVERVTEYKPINTEQESAMRDSIIAELAGLGIEVNADISDSDLQAKYKEALTADNGDNGADNDDIAKVVANAVKNAVTPINNQLKSLKDSIELKDKSELQEMAEVIANSDSYKGLDADTIAGLGKDKVKTMYANCAPSFGFPSTMNVNSGDDESVSSVDDLPAE